MGLRILDIYKTELRIKEAYPALKEKIKYKLMIGVKFENKVKDDIFLLLFSNEYKL